LCSLTRAGAVNRIYPALMYYPDSRRPLSVYVMKHKQFSLGLGILSEEYQKLFVDDSKYSGQVSRHLVGLASIIEECNKTWRPSVSDLLKLLPESEETNELVSAGLAFCVAQFIGLDFPGPAILLYGAALNTIGKEPNIELDESISKAKNILTESKLLDNEHINSVINAAIERASFDKVSKMLRDEFRQGIFDSGVEIGDIEQLVRDIVNATHDVRHKGLIERLVWTHKTISYGGSSTDAGYMHRIDKVEFKNDKLRDLLPYANLGCAYSIYRRIDERRKLFGS